MPIRQAYNGKIKAWVKYDFDKERGFRPLDVKEREPGTPFKGITIKGNRKR